MDVGRERARPVRLVLCGLKVHATTVHFSVRDAISSLCISLHGPPRWIPDVYPPSYLPHSHIPRFASLGKVATPKLGHTLWAGWVGKNVSKIASAHYDGEWVLVLTSDGLVYSLGDCDSGLGQGTALCLGLRV